MSSALLRCRGKKAKSPSLPFSRSNNHLSLLVEFTILDDAVGNEDAPSRIVIMQNVQVGVMPIEER